VGGLGFFFWGFFGGGGELWVGFGAGLWVCDGDGGGFWVGGGRGGFGGVVGWGLFGLGGCGGGLLSVGAGFEVGVLVVCGEGGSRGGYWVFGVGFFWGVGGGRVGGWVVVCGSYGLWVLVFLFFGLGGWGVGVFFRFEFCLGVYGDGFGGVQHPGGFWGSSKLGKGKGARCMGRVRRGRPIGEPTEAKQRVLARKGFGWKT